MTYTIEVATPDDVSDVVRIDDEAMPLYAEAGFPIDLAPSHPFIVAERARWLREAERQWVFFARHETLGRVGFAALDCVDDAPYLDQLSVRRSAMKRGAGRFLLHHAVAWAKDRGGGLWLTTYGHLAWNRPFYEREGFRVVPEAEWGPSIRHHVEEQRASLPAPDQRLAMCQPLRV